VFPVTTRTHNLLVKDRDRDLFAYEGTLNIEYRHTGKTRPGHWQAYNNKLAAIETLNTLQPSSSGSQEVRSLGTQQKKPSDLRLASPRPLVTRSAPKLLVGPESTRASVRSDSASPVGVLKNLDDAEAATASGNKLERNTRTLDSASGREEAHGSLPVTGCKFKRAKQRW
jgi:hypothetical protein